jgi:hypothetical protein
MHSHDVWSLNLKGEDIRRLGVSGKTVLQKRANTLSGAALNGGFHL